MAIFGASDPRRIKSVGSFSELVVAVISLDAGTGTFTIPQLKSIDGITMTGVLKDMVCVATAIAGNVVTYDNESGSANLTSVIAWGKGNG